MPVNAARAPPEARLRRLLVTGAQERQRAMRPSATPTGAIGTSAPSPFWTQSRLNAPTGGFYELSAAEARDRGIDMVSQTRLEAHRGRDHPKATFRLYWNHDEVRKNPPGHRDHMRYAVYNAHDLWGWQKDHAMDPTNSFQISREDWLALYHRYDNGGAIPDWVWQLPEIEWPGVATDLPGAVTVWVLNAHGQDFVTGKPFHAPRWEAYVDGALRFRQLPAMNTPGPRDGLYFQGEPGKEFVTAIKQKKAWLHMEGTKGKEVVTWVKKTQPNGDIHKVYYNPVKELGPPRTRGKPRPNDSLTGRKVKEVYRKGNGSVNEFTAHFTGPKGHERCVRVVKNTLLHGEIKIFLRGPKGREAKYEVHNTRTVAKLYYRGTKGNEYLWKRFFGGFEFLYDGLKGQEALRSYYPAGNPDGAMRVWYEGPKGQERTVRSREDNGQMHVEDGLPVAPELQARDY